MCSKTSGCVPTWSALINQLHRLNSFGVHTGNINNYLELKLKRFASSAEELSACLDIQFANLPEDTQVNENGILLLADKSHRDSVYERDDLKITLKVFIESFNFEHVRSAIETSLAQLKIENIEQLIIAFPQPEEADESVAKTNETPSADDLNTSDFDGKWFEQVLQLWHKVEDELVDTGKVLSVGVADFHLAPLQKLYESVKKVKPYVDHFNIEGCCVVPPDLQAYAREHDIQLLTHNDPHPFPLKEIFRTFCSGSTESDMQCCSSFEPVWSARYTLWVRKRSLMASKGYIVQFTEAGKQCAT